MLTDQNPLKILQKQINVLATTAQNNEYIQRLNNFIMQGEFNILLRNLCARTDMLPVVNILLEHKSFFNIDVNGKGVTSQKTALDVAIDHDCRETIIYLIKLEEVEVAEAVTQKLIAKYGHSLRNEYISPVYASLVEQLAEFPAKVKAHTLEHETTSQKIVGTLHAYKLSQEKIKDTAVARTLINEIRPIIHNLINSVAEQARTLQTLQSDFDRLNKQFLPYASAFERLLLGNEYTKTNLAYSIKQGCQTNRNRLKEHGELIENNIQTLISKTAFYISIFLPFLQTPTEPLRDLDPIEPTTVTAPVTTMVADIQAELIQPLGALTKPVCSALEHPAPKQITFFATESVGQSISYAELNSENEERHSLDNQQNELIPNLKTNGYMKPTKLKKHAKQPIAQPAQIINEPYLVNEKDVALDNLLNEIQQLKQKGNPKLDSFIAIIYNFQNISNDVELKKTKSGYLLSHEKNRLSFHKPHNGNGVDKRALSDLTKLITEAMGEQSGSVENRKTQ